MPYDLTEPCEQCPLRSDKEQYLTQAELRRVMRAANRHEYACYETAKQFGQAESCLTGRNQFCAGALILQRKGDYLGDMPATAARVSRNGQPIFDPSRLNLKAPVFESWINAIAAAPRDGSEVSCKTGRWLRKQVAVFPPMAYSTGPVIPESIERGRTDAERKLLKDFEELYQHPKPEAGDLPGTVTIPATATTATTEQIRPVKGGDGYWVTTTENGRTVQRWRQRITTPTQPREPELLHWLWAEPVYDARPVAVKKGKPLSRPQTPATVPTSAITNLPQNITGAGAAETGAGETADDLLGEINKVRDDAEQSISLAHALLDTLGDKPPGTSEREEVMRKAQEAINKGRKAATETTRLIQRHKEQQGSLSRQYAQMQSQMPLPLLPAGKEASDAAPAVTATTGD